MECFFSKLAGLQLAISLKKGICADVSYEILRIYFGKANVKSINEQLFLSCSSFQDPVNYLRWSFCDKRRNNGWALVITFVKSSILVVYGVFRI